MLGLHVVCSLIHVEEKANEKEADKTQDTSEEKTDTTQDKDKTEKESKDKSPNKVTKDSLFKEHKKVSKERETKPEPADSTKAKVDKKEPTEQQPKEVEGKKDPGGVNGTKPEASNEPVDAKELDTSSDTDNSQQVQNGTCRKVHIGSHFSVFSIRLTEYISLVQTKKHI